MEDKTIEQLSADIATAHRRLSEARNRARIATHSGYLGKCFRQESAFADGDMHLRVDALQASGQLFGVIVHRHRDTVTLRSNAEIYLDIGNPGAKEIATDEFNAVARSAIDKLSISAMWNADHDNVAMASHG